MKHDSESTSDSPSLTEQVGECTDAIADAATGYPVSIQDRVGVHAGIATVALAALSTTAAAQSGDPCSSGIGALVMELQGMVLAVALGVIVLGAAVGMALRMFTPFPGASSVGGVMLLAAIGGPLAFVVVLTFIEMIFATVGISAGQACSPFL